ncbi:glycosyltransferase family 2 protein [Aurantibacter sp.]|uniref:glycosyltransferase family 2 protein n=1 Tax=Aurantibacter sp. TaxID=2807103 RepID=UPI0035C7A291
MDISVIIINYHSSEYTIKCINSIIEQTKEINYELIIVDNNSNKKDLKRLEDFTKNKKIMLVKSKINLGFGAGNMFGAQYATGNYLAFLNNDVILIENSLQILFDFLKNNKRIGLVGPNQITENNAFFKQSYSHYNSVHNIPFTEKNSTKHYTRLYGKEKLKTPFKVDLVSGAFMLFKLEAFNSINGFDQNIFLFYEEIDVSTRLSKKDYDTYFHPNTTFIHYQGKSSGNTDLKIEYLVSYLYIIQKNYSYLKFKYLKTLTQLRLLFKSISRPKYFKLLLLSLKSGNSLSYSKRVKN